MGRQGIDILISNAGIQIVHPVEEFSFADWKIPEQAKTLGITEEQVIKDVMLKETVDGEFTTTDDVAHSRLSFDRCFAES